jgi:site-specific recombinase XerD
MAHTTPSHKPVRRGYRLETEQYLWYRAWQAALAAVEQRGRPDTLEEGLALHLQDLERRGRRVATTCRHQWCVLRGFLSWAADRHQERLVDLDRDLLLDYLHHLLTLDLSPYARKHARTYLKQLLRFLFAGGWIPQDLASTLRLSTRLPSQPPPRILKPCELARLLDAPRQWRRSYRGGWKKYLHWLTLRDTAVLALLIATGIRTCEACSLSLDDMDLKRGVAVIHSKGNHLYIRPQRLVFLDTPRLTTALGEYVSVRPKSTSQFLFTSSTGFPLRTQALGNIVTKYVRIAQLDAPVTAHTLRHTFCTHLITAGLDPYTVQQLMGHRNVTHTLRWYTHFNRRQLHAEWRNSQPLHNPQSQ